MRQEKTLSIDEIMQNVDKEVVHMIWTKRRPPILPNRHPKYP